MNWYLKARCWLATLLAALGTVPAASTFRSATIELPDLVSGILMAMPVPVLLPVVPASLAIWSMSRTAPAHESTALRRIPAYDLTALMVVLLCQVITAAALSAWYPLDESLAVVRNMAGYVALALVVRPVAGPVIANLTITAFPVICVRLGRVYEHPRPSGAWWAWPLHEASSIAALLQVSLLCLAATAVVWRATRPGIFVWSGNAG